MGQTDNAVTFPYRPTGHTRHALLADAPAVIEYLPAGHALALFRELRPVAVEK